MRIDNYVGRDSAAGVAARSGLEVRGSKPGGGDIYHIRPDWPWGPVSLLHNLYRAISGRNAAGPLC
jgi:hypothetical protein